MAYKLIWVEVTEAGETYTGDYEACIAEYHSEPGLTAEALVDAFNDEIIKDGGIPLSFRVWRDGSNWKIEATAYGVPAEGPWPIILIYVVSAIAIIGITIALLRWGLVPVTKAVTELVRGYPPIINPYTGEVSYPPERAIISTTAILAGAAIILGGGTLAYLALRKK